MYDRETISLWIHTTGEAVIGKYQDQSLEFLPSTVTTWKKWRTEYPQTLILNVRKGKNHRFNLKKNPKSGGLSIGEPEDELKFYPLTILQEKRVLNDELAGKKIVVVFDPDDWIFAAFIRGNHSFFWKDRKIVDETGEEWQLLGGTSNKRALQPVPAVTWQAKAWQRFYPDGEIYSVESTED